jgi:hypothetical protein
MPVVIFFACLDLEQKSSFMDGHYLTYIENTKRESISQYLFMVRANVGFCGNKKPGPKPGL